jgi:hypothetical protein
MLSNAGIVLTTGFTPQYSAHHFYGPSHFPTVTPICTLYAVPSANRTPQVNGGAHV